MRGRFVAARRRRLFNDSFIIARREERAGDARAQSNTDMSLKQNAGAALALICAVAVWRI